MESGKLGKVFEIVAHYDCWREAYLEYARDVACDRLNGIVYGHSCHSVDQLID